MRRLAETRGVRFELVRHFLGRLFEGEWTSERGQWRSAAIGLFALVLPSGLLLAPSDASRATSSSALAEEIALVGVLASVTGLMALLQWRALFPSRRDFLVLASLPVRPGQIFLARFVSVLGFSAAIIGTMNLLPSLIAPMAFGEHWGLDVRYLQEAGAHAVASALACVFVFFTTVALQGAVLNVIPGRYFSRVSSGVQGVCMGLFLLGAFFSWQVRDSGAVLLAKLTEAGGWLPAWWFVALHERLAGRVDPAWSGMAVRAWWAAGMALTAAAGLYAISYRRHRKLLLEQPVQLSKPAMLRWNMSRLLSGGSPRGEAVIDFMAKTLARNPAHRTLWLAYLGAAAAVLLNSSIIDGGIFSANGRWSRALQFAVHFWPLACSVVVLNGFRHVLSVPAELSANWIFQTTESQGLKEWMSAVERFVMVYAIAPIYVALFPVSGELLGWGVAARMTVLQILVSLTIFEVLFYSWQKLPFTCSHVPAQSSIVTAIGKYAAMLCVVTPVLSIWIAVASHALLLFPFYLGLSGVIWIGLRRRRREGWGETNLVYEDGTAEMTALSVKEITPAGLQRVLRQ